MASGADEMVDKAFDPKQQDVVAKAIEQLSPEEAGYFLDKLERAIRKRKIQLGGYLAAMVVWLFGIVWALFYYGVTLGSRHSATLGMRAMDIEMRTWYGSPAYFVLGAVHAIVFWITVSVLTPLVLLVCLFNDRRRCLHDMLVGTVIINNELRASALRASPPHAA